MNTEPDPSVTAQAYTIIHELVVKENVIDKNDSKQYKDFVQTQTQSFNSLNSVEKTLLWGLLEICRRRDCLRNVDYKKQYADFYIEDRKRNLSFLKGFKQEISSLPDNEKLELYAFVSYCVFSTYNGESKDSDSNREYDKQLNAAILNQVYLDSLNNQQSWKYRDKTYEAPQFSMSDLQGLKLLESVISVKEAVIWTHLNYISTEPWEDRSVDVFDNYHEHIPSTEWDIHQAIAMSFDKSYQNKTDDEKKNIAYRVFSDLFSIWLTGEKTELFGMSDFRLYPGYVYCFYKLVQFLNKNDFNYFFPQVEKGNLQYEKYRFTAIWLLNRKQEDEIPKPLLYELGIVLGKHETISKEDLEKLINSYIEIPEIQEQLEKMAHLRIYLLRCMFYFLLWDLSSFWHEFIPDSNNSENLGFKEHTELMKMFMEPFFEKTEEWLSNQTLLKLMNSMLEKYHSNGKLETFNLEEIDPDIFRYCLFNLSKISARDRNCLLSFMDFTGELRGRKDFYSQPKRNQSFPDRESSDEEIERLQEKQRILKEDVDKGFELNYIKQHIAAVPVSGIDYYRNMTCKFFNDTDKLYKLKSARFRKSKWKIESKEEYRISRNNNFTTHYLYCAERNTERHYCRLSALNAVLNDDYPENLLFSFIDARDFLYQQKVEKKDSPYESIQIDYLLKSLEIYAALFADRFKLIDSNLLRKQSIWGLLYTNDKKALKIKLPDNMNYKEVLGEQYMFEIERFFEFMFCIKPNFLESYYMQISAYLIYLCIRMDQIDEVLLKKEK